MSQTAMLGLIFREDRCRIPPVEFVIDSGLDLVLVDAAVPDDGRPRELAREQRLVDSAEIGIAVFGPHRPIVGDGIFVRPDWSQHRVQGNGRL